MVQAKLPLDDWGAFVRMAHVITNNYYVRVLGGEAAYRLPLGNVTSDHLADALKTLQVTWHGPQATTPSRRTRLTTPF